VAYNSFFILGLLCSMQIPFVGFQPVKTSEHMASAGVFALLQVRLLKIMVSKRETGQVVFVPYFLYIKQSCGLVSLRIRIQLFISVQIKIV
jgi:dolichyl-diphosphooligosaccharide--protein glycosyltransferase